MFDQFGITERMFNEIKNIDVDKYGIKRFDKQIEGLTKQESETLEDFFTAFLNDHSYTKPDESFVTGIDKTIK